MTGLAIRDVVVGGRSGVDVRMEGGRITAIGAGVGAGCAEEIDGRGGALIAGLVDHHIHLLASAARAESVVLDDVGDLGTLGARLRGAGGGGWLRAVGCAPALAEEVTREVLDGWVPGRPVRMQDQSGALWMLNSAGLAALGEVPAEGTGRDAAGRPTGRLWRADAWLRARVGRAPPDLAGVGRALARAGVTAVTDASVSTDAGGAALLAAAGRCGALPQRLTLMSGGALAAPGDGAFAVGPVKVVLDERDLPPVEAVVGWIGAARGQGRAVAVHCVGTAELALCLAAFEAAGARRGDRIEHGSVIPAAAIPVIRALGLTVVTQPGLVFGRGDRYLDEMDEGEHGDLYRCASLLAAGVKVAFSSDAPYGPVDPWVGMRAAVTRMTQGGRGFGLQEAVSAGVALEMYQGDADFPGEGKRVLEVGGVGDVCLVGEDGVGATVVGGRVVYVA